MPVFKEQSHQIFDEVTIPADVGLQSIESGKVRRRWLDKEDKKIVLVTTNKISAHDRVLDEAIPHKGQVLNRLAHYWFKKTRHIVKNHVEGLPHPNVLVAEKVRPLPVEVIVRGYMTGVTDTSIWTMYERGEREMYGQSFERKGKNKNKGYKKNDKLDAPVITPTTKAERGAHDGPLDDQEVMQIFEREGFDPALWTTIKEKAFALFKYAQNRAKKSGFLLVDTKIEFGLDENGELVVIDELFTPDSSRYWLLSTYEALIAEGKEPDNYDKEYLRLALKEMGYKKDQPFPPLTPELIQEISRRYIAIFEAITGEKITEEDPETLQVEIEQSIIQYFSQTVKRNRKNN